MMETDKTNFKFGFDRFDTYDWYLRLGPLSNANAKYIHGTLPTWNDFLAHPNYDAFWKSQAMAYLLKKPTVPNLNVAGFWDQEESQQGGEEGDGSREDEGRGQAQGCRKHAADGGAKGDAGGLSGGEPTDPATLFRWGQTITHHRH